MSKSKSNLGSKALISCVLLFAITAVYVLKLDAKLPHESTSEVLLSDISIDRLNGNRVYQNLPFNGEAVTYSKNGRMIEAEEFLNGRRHGHLKKWFENGVLAFESYYENGKRNGVSKSWWSNGNLRSLTEYIDDKADGVAWSWYRTGEKFKRINYLAGEPVGIQKGWRLNGKLFSNYEYKNGRVFGLMKANLCVTLEDEEIQITY